MHSPQPSRTPTEFARHQTRRDLIASEHRTTRSRRPRRADSVLAASRSPNGWAVRRKLPAALRSSSASLAAALLLTTYLLPAYADTATPDSAASGPTPATDLQSLEVGAQAVGSSASTRDPFTVTKAIPAGYRPYSQTDDTFVNNPNSPIQWPFTEGVPISSWFGYRTPPCNGCSSYHEGLDMNPGAGTPIQAIADGVVTEIGNPSGSFGVYAIIQHQIAGQQVTSVYAHMLEGSLALSVGDTVTVGQPVGQVGSTGLSTGAHLHFGIQINGTDWVDPFAWLKEKVEP